MYVKRVFPDAAIQGAILDAARSFEARIAVRLEEYRETLARQPVLIETERTNEEEITA